MPGAPEFEGRKHRRRGKSVAVNLSTARKAGVKSGRDKPASQDANLRRQRGVNGRSEDRRRQPCRWQIDVRALAKCVHPGVRPSRAMDAQFFPEHLGEGGLDPILDGVAARLALPTRVASAVVGDDEFKPPAA